MYPSSPPHSEHESDTVFGSDNEVESEPTPPPNTPTRHRSSEIIMYLPNPPTPTLKATTAGVGNHLGRQPVTPRTATALDRAVSRYQKAAAAEQAFQQTAAAIEATLSLKRQLGIAPSHDHHPPDGHHHQHPSFLPQDHYLPHHPHLHNYTYPAQTGYHRPRPQQPLARKSMIQDQIDAVYARIGATQIQRNQAEDRRRYYATEAQRLHDELTDHMETLARLKAQKKAVVKVGPGDLGRWLGQGQRHGQGPAGWNAKGPGKKGRQVGKAGDNRNNHTGERRQVGSVDGFGGDDARLPDAVLEAWREKIQQGRKAAAGL
ncbi:hypothetical protein B0T22DRAFT_509154 [Podospora appendiculata]|uniref:Uncharacterized protein n=1 Tax=Podospora appendiculata TaxID=314037 RepID=A0AAE1CIM6_9PEZI|nr:hypothetical protein B0T22DRAFT_509154 [Podospora appendiculata]